jgi:hypothetical protein
MVSGLTIILSSTFFFFNCDLDPSLFLELIDSMSHVNKQYNSVVELSRLIVFFKIIFALKIH